jgi:hypothetical protein
MNPTGTTQTSGSDVTITITPQAGCNDVHLVITRNGTVVVDETTHDGNHTFHYTLSDGQYLITATCCGLTWNGGFAIAS